MRLFSDPEVYQAELKYLFARSWNVVGHESEIPEPGDFVTRKIAEDSVIVARGDDGLISVLLNVCSHRGMQVCRTEAGNASKFKCPYHGWVYGQQGKMVGAPFERDMYGDSLPKSDLGLRRARVESYAGIIFANWDDSAAPLSEYLGEFTWYLDTLFKRTTGGLECVGAPQRFLVRANWKIASEQFCGADGYHSATLHKSLLEGIAGVGDAGALRKLTREALYGVDLGSPEGHGGRALDRGIGFRDHPATARAFADGVGWEESLTLVPPENLPVEAVPGLATTLSAGQIHALMTYPPGTGGIFPNVGFLSTNIRVHVPLGVDSFEMINWVLVEKDAPAEFKAQVRRKMLRGFGSAGIIEQDDSESWPSIQKSATGYMGRQAAMRYQAFVGHNPPPGWEGGSHVYHGFTKDDSGWDFWKRYRQFLTGEQL